MDVDFTATVYITIDEIYQRVLEHVCKVSLPGKSSDYASERDSPPRGSFPANAAQLGAKRAQAN